MKDIVEKSPNLDKKSEILARIIQRINDEEGVRKVCLETFQNLWFTPNKDCEKNELKERVNINYTIKGKLMVAKKGKAEDVYF